MVKSTPTARTILKYLTPVLALLLMSPGCARMEWMASPNVAGRHFSVDDDECGRESRRESYVAKLANYSQSKEWTDKGTEERVYVACMSGKGWRQSTVPNPSK